MERQLGIGITLQKKVLINLGYQHQLSSSAWMRFRVYMAASGKPVAFGMHTLVAEKTGLSWRPHTGLGVEIMPNRFKRGLRWTPYVCVTLGAGYYPHANLANMAELVNGFFPKLRLFLPMGISLWHFNGLR